MDLEQNWAEALNINPENLAEWSANVPEGTPLLVWCLQQGLVPLSAYQEWAQQHFGLPVLQSEYFTQSFDRAATLKLRESGDWNPWCFPVGQWEDVTVVACVEPPSEKPDGHFAFVLADPKLLKLAWEGGASDTTKTALEPSPEAPAGISFTATKIFRLNLDDITLASTPTSPLPSSTPQAIDVDLIDEDEVMPGSPPPAPGTHKARTMAQTNLDHIPQTKTLPAITENEKKSSSLSADEVSEIDAAFDKLKIDFECALIMRCFENDAKPYRWDEALNQMDVEKCTVNLNYPSFFRIVAKTLLPYHGYVIDSPAHREFFSGLNLKTKPACVTAVPLKADGLLWGVLVALGGEGAQGPEALHRVQKIADKLTHALEETWLNSVAA